MVLSVPALKTFYKTLDMRAPWETSPRKQLELSESTEDVLERVNR